MAGGWIPVGIYPVPGYGTGMTDNDDETPSYLPLVGGGKRKTF